MNMIEELKTTVVRGVKMMNKEILTDTYTFDDLIESNAFYVDKTAYFHRLVSGGGKCYFCSRPRRFGKSLAISMLKAIFEGKKGLFKGLYIYDTDYDWQTYPIIHLDMARCDCTSAENLRISLLARVDSIAKDYGVEIQNPIPAIGFDSLISELRRKTGKKVVILIDEYDKPLTENIGDLAEIEKVRKVLDAFYQIIKGQNANERFVFMTGVTKFSKVSIFSKLNNLTDITMSRDYACMFGYTQDEMEKNFMPYVDSYIEEEAERGNTVDKASFLTEVKRWYNGFKFEEESDTVYNPVSIGQFFSNHCKFKNYWFSTGTPSLVINLAKKNALSIERINEAAIEEGEINTFMVEDITKSEIADEDFITLLFQTGYLTIESKIVINGENYYKLHYPNYEVHKSFERILVEVYTRLESKKVSSVINKFYTAATSGDTARIIELLQNMLSQIPYSVQMKAERYYQSLFYLFFKMCGMKISAESETNIGRIDAVIEAGQHVYIFELKLNKTAAKAMEQIENKKYFEPFIEDARERGQTIHCVGLSFNNDKDVRNIDDWQEIN